MMKKILVDDSNPLKLRLLTDLPKNKEFQILTAKDGLVALNILKSDIPDVF